mmetsp:Transcript_6829/g.12102  ORF Transcript_6829/g.12102 Transcript_6829/m.12102 type:complete len:190 (+) Transcript_6829:85-654(+)|eukprot:CAMPEP_0197644266 /NCGR_PEP_ID=MMETSP1338-20131121/17301_1 /TAXON_ID=43686 ORGANISM="Pelagodinium beii, Strain RCC1491" /NCGR_SAMPLE_ID=MMETSP1338 /ASSEMBLY_ACC=CAM_ASM_000754 /LENGTH=189 /DNA_ID=CAMNT_0043217635 /DNA_START=78 /DNA_END=647 /DNA_ORIENTATION=+
MGNAMCGIPSTDLLQLQLEEVCQAAKAHYAIYWKEASGELRPVASYHRPDLVSVLREDEATFPEMCLRQGLKMKQDEGPAGRCLLSKTTQLVQPGSEASTHAALAQEFNIHSMVFVPVANGILEIGTPQTWKRIPDVVYEIEMVDKISEIDDEAVEKMRLPWTRKQSKESTESTSTVSTAYTEVSGISA